MTRLFLQNPDALKNLLKGKRFVFGVGDAKEKPEQAAVPEEDKFENRKQQARGELDSIYESGKYDTYNFRKLPQEFKDHMRNNFGAWIDSNIAKYDKDKNSGINAAEYDDFKSKLNEKVTEILDRLIEAKEQKKKQAIENKETAEQAKETQKRLEGINTDKLNEANLENEDGCYTELLSYQKDFEKEASGFAALAGVFSGAKEKADNANKSHYTGATAFGEMLVSWVEDIPEVKDAKAAKEQAVADFRTKLAEMKKRQKDRQARGTTLNGAPEKIRGRVATQYDEAKNKTREELDLAKKANEENRREKARLAEEIKLNEERKRAAQKEYDMLVIRFRQAEQRKQEVEKRTGEMRETATGFGELAERARKQQGGQGGAERGQPSKPGQMSAEQLAKQAQESASKAREATGELETGLAEADKAVGGMSGSAMVIQRRLAELNSARKLMTSDLSKREKTGELLTEAATGLNDHLEKLSAEEKQRIEQVDMLDSAIAETVIQVDTSNFELIKKGEDYLKQLSSMDVSGPGLLDTAGAMIMGIPGVETSYNWSGDKLSAGWQWAKSAPVLGAGIEIVGYMGEGWVKAWDGIGSGLSWVGDKLHLGEAWDWMSEASKHMSIGNPTGNPLVDAILDTFSGGGFGTIIEVFAGVTEGAKGLVQGLGMMIRNPVDLIKGLGALLNHPGMIIDALIQKDKWGSESASKIIGRMMVDVITTLTGAGATATGVKSAIAAVKIGGMGMGKAILLGIEMFGRTFIKDIGTLLKGVVELTKNAVPGAAKLVKTVANGGKKVKSSETAVLAAAKSADKMEDAFKAVEGVRGKPDLFKKLMREHPEYLALHSRYMKKLGRQGQAASGQKAKKTAPDKEPSTAAPAGVERMAGADEATVPAVRGAGKPLRSAADETPPTSGRTGRTKPEEAAVITPAAKTAGLAADDVTRPIRGISKRAEDAESALAAPAKRHLPKAKPDFTVKVRRPDMAPIFYEAESKLANSPAFRELAKKGFDYYWHAERLPDYDLRLLANGADEFSPEMLENILSQRYKIIEGHDGRVVRIYEGGRLGKGGYGVVSDCAYVIGNGERLQTGAVKKIRDLKALEDELEAVAKEIEHAKDQHSAEKIMELRKRHANLTFELHNLRDVFAREMRGFAAVQNMPDTSGLLSPRFIAHSQAEDWLIIYDKIDDPSGHKVNLGDRLYGNETLTTKLKYMSDATSGLDKLHANGYIHLDFKSGNIFVGERAGRSAGHLGDLAIIHYSELPFLEVAEMRIRDPLNPNKTTTQYALIKKSPSGRIQDSRQIAITPSYFSAAHMRRVIDNAKGFLTDLDERRLSPRDVNPPRELMATGDAHQVAVTLVRDYFEISDIGTMNKKLIDVRKKIAEAEKIDPAKAAGLRTMENEFLSGLSAANADRLRYGEGAIKEFQAGLQALGERLKNVDANITMSEVSAEIDKLIANLDKAAARNKRKAAGAHTTPMT